MKTTYGEDYTNSWLHASMPQPLTRAPTYPGRGAIFVNKTEVKPSHIWINHQMLNHQLSSRIAQYPERFQWISVWKSLNQREQSLFSPLDPEKLTSLPKTWALCVRLQLSFVLFLPTLFVCIEKRSTSLLPILVILFYALKRGTMTDSAIGNELALVQSFIWFIRRQRMRGTHGLSKIVGSKILGWGVWLPL